MGQRVGTRDDAVAIVDIPFVSRRYGNVAGMEAAPQPYRELREGVVHEDPRHRA